MGTSWEPGNTHLTMGFMVHHEKGIVSYGFTLKINHYCRYPEEPRRNEMGELHSWVHGGAPTIVINGVSLGFKTLLIRVVTLFISGRGPPCTLLATDSHPLPAGTVESMISFSPGGTWICSLEGKTSWVYQMKYYSIYYTIIDLIFSLHPPQKTA